jgi:hypothetical protein
MHAIRKRIFQLMASRGVYLWTVYWKPIRAENEVVDVVGTFTNPKWKVVAYYILG